MHNENYQNLYKSLMPLFTKIIKFKNDYFKDNYFAKNFITRLSSSAKLGVVKQPFLEIVRKC